MWYNNDMEIEDKSLQAFGPVNDKVRDYQEAFYRNMAEFNSRYVIMQNKRIPGPYEHPPIVLVQK